MNLDESKINHMFPNLWFKTKDSKNLIKWVKSNKTLILKEKEDNKINIVYRRDNKDINSKDIDLKDNDKYDKIRSFINENT